jgi:hypothetical protein
MLLKKNSLHALKESDYLHKLLDDLNKCNIEVAILNFVTLRTLMKKRSRIKNTTFASLN